MPTLFRPIQPNEQAEAVQLWMTVFGRDTGYFARYYDADPWYQEGDSLGAWVDGTLASVVHVCRRPLAWEGSSLLCGGIANVATLPAYRGQGLSRQLLRLMIERMESIGVDFSMLGTSVPDHYAVLGWEPLDLPQFRLTPNGERPLSKRTLRPARPIQELVALYGHAPRPLQQERPSSYFDKWVGWQWMDSQARLCQVPTGYLILSVSHESSCLLASEWRASDAETEMLLFEAALAEHPESIDFAALPQHCDLAVLAHLGHVELSPDSGQMIRRIGLSEQEYTRVKEAYISGRAVEWPADGY